MCSDFPRERETQERRGMFDVTCHHISRPNSASFATMELTECIWCVCGTDLLAAQVPTLRNSPSNIVTSWFVLPEHSLMGPPTHAFWVCFGWQHHLSYLHRYDMHRCSSYSFLIHSSSWGFGHWTRTVAGREPIFEEVRTVSGPVRRLAAVERAGQWEWRASLRIWIFS